MDEVEVEFPPGMTGLAHACTFRRRGNIVDFKVSRSDERAFHALFGFDNAAVGGRTDSVTGFVPASETREHVTLRIPRPALINQIL